MFSLSKLQKKFSKSFEPERGTIFYFVTFFSYLTVKKSSVNLVHIFRISFYKNTYGLLPLKISIHSFWKGVHTTPEDSTLKLSFESDWYFGDIMVLRCF